MLISPFLICFFFLHSTYFDRNGFALAARLHKIVSAYSSIHTRNHIPDIQIHDVETDNLPENFEDTRDSKQGSNIKINNHEAYNLNALADKPQYINEILEQVLRNR
ncbi:hypothetical protein LSTR_LSTR004758 [Laodelphax striatellus]|uniref:Uncharacterized protein n=1 Tax=Laodelphax striatellus TaxID=195883 RepID=A0A482XJ13_LAOST|nr:hypothetical protein LSTR_LSTR004758 [Laodelphax striatellus]